MSDRIQLAKTAGERILELYREDLRPSDILTKKSFENALRSEMALGCSTNSVLHLTAIAYERGVKLDITDIDRISRDTPQLCKLNPASQVFITDLNQVGGIPAVMKELARGGKLNTDCKTVLGTHQRRARRGRRDHPQAGRPVPQGRRHRRAAGQYCPRRRGGQAGCGCSRNDAAHRPGPLL